MTGPNLARRGNGQRVTIWNTIVWGWDMDTAGNVTPVGPRPAGLIEQTAHILLLIGGQGTGPAVFAAAGWSFRAGAN
jgi:hypothetical protein